MKKKFLNLKNTKSLEKKNKFILKYIDNFTNDLNKDLIKINFFNLPNKEVTFFIKKTFIELFDFKNCKFDKKISLFYLPYYIFIFIFYSIYVYIFKKKNYQIKKYLILFDNIDSKKELELYDEFLKFKDKKKFIFRTSKKIISKNKKLIFFPRYKGYILNYKTLIKVYYLLFLSIKISLKKNINFLYLSLKIIDNIFFFDALFKNINAKYLIMHQYYMSNNIKNFYFKLSGGYKTSLIQKNILSMNTNGFYFDSDYFLCLGKNTQCNNFQTKSRISKNIIIGSLLMHANKKKINKKLKFKKKFFDILYIAGNEFQPDGQYDTYYHHNIDYKTHLNWLIKIKKENPKLRVAFKHHSNNKDNYEVNLLERSGVTIISKHKNSYELCLDSKMICSWASTMILELKPLNYFSFFLDPNYRNDQFFKFLKNSKKIRIGNYENFKNLVIESQKKTKKFESDLKYCSYFQNVVRKIYHSLN